MAKKTARVAKKPQRVPRRRLPALARGSEAKLLDLITNPCEAELVNGYSTTTTGIVQRFNRFITPVAGTETAFAYVFNPCSQTDTGSFASIVQKLAIGGGTPSNLTTAGPGHAFLDAQADNVGCLAACIEVLYTGKLVDRQGYIGVCQLPYNVATDIANGTTDLPTLMAYCQQVSPIPSHAVELKWSPSIRALSANAQVTETASGIDNCLMVVAVGVNPNQFVVKFTTVYEYQPKFALGLPAPRATKTIPIGAPERIVTALDRMGHWWHNLGSAAAAAYRMGGSMVYAANQTARLARGAQAALGPATTLLALTG